MEEVASLGRLPLQQFLDGSIKCCLPDGFGFHVTNKA